jgi:hypothetical protein
MTNDDKLAISKTTLFSCFTDFGRDSRKISWESGRCELFWKEMQDKIQDVTGVVTPDN